VAAAQCEALASLGHDVTLFAAAPVDTASSRELNGYLEQLYPAKRLSARLGFAGMHAPGLRSRLSTGGDFDIAHVHLARDLVTLPAIRSFERAGVPTVAQPHGMIDRSQRPLAALIDGLATRRALEQARAVLSLTAEEDGELAHVAPRARVRRIANGIRIPPIPSYSDRDDEVLFLARLHPRKRPLTFIAMAELVAEQHASTRFTLVGPDEGEGAAVQAAIERSRFRDRIEWRGAASPDDTATLLAGAAAFVLPSVGEVFPMTMLEAFAAGTPTVATDSLGIADDCREYGAAAITDGSTQQLALAVRKVLEDPDHASELRRGGERFLRERLDIDAVAAQLEQLYQTESLVS
jgi:glycosyltransferase involved in cell wall biosynthesis